MQVTEDRWWRDPRRLDPWSERALGRRGSLPSWRVWLLRIGSVVLLVLGLVSLAAGNWSGAILIVLPILNISMLSVSARKQVLGRRQT